MTLYAIDGAGLKQITRVPHEKEFDQWMHAIDPDDIQRIVGELNTLLDRQQVETSSFIPGEDWTNTPYQPIYEAAGFDEESAAQFFGLILWHTIMEREDDWSFGRYFDDIKGMTYFRIDPP